MKKIGLLYAGLLLLVSNDATSSERQLFQFFPGLSIKLAHIKLTDQLPTPLIPMCSIGALYGARNLYCKDDGQTGCEFGGNKVRKLEFLLADAIANRAESVVTVGGAGSNHALATAVYAYKLGLKAHVLLTPQLVTQYTRRNLLMNLYYHARIEYFQNKDSRNVRLVELMASKRNYYIPSGGSNEIGSIGFVNAAYELKAQCQQMKIDYPRYVYSAYGSYGTIAGLLVGLKAAGMQCTVVGVSSDDTPGKIEAQRIIIERAQAVNRYLHELDEQFPILEFDSSDLDIRLLPRHYAQVTKLVHDAIERLYTYEQIQCDTTYSGGAAAVLLQDLENNSFLASQTIVLWKTYADGAYKQITEEVTYKSLPESLHSYFECPLQTFDDQGY